MTHNRRQLGLWRKADVYSAFRMAKIKETELRKKNDDITSLRTKLELGVIEQGAPGLFAPRNTVATRKVPQESALRGTTINPSTHRPAGNQTPRENAM